MTVVPLVIGGADVHSKDTYDVIGPDTGSVVHQSSNADVSHATDAVLAAAEAAESWAQTTPTQRRAIFLKAESVLEKRAAELKEYMIKETGSDAGWADFNIYLGKECLLDCASRITALEGRIPSPSDPSAGALVVKEPYGVILAMAPW